MTRRAIPVRRGNLVTYREVGEDKPDITRARAAGDLLLLAGGILAVLSPIAVLYAAELISFGDYCFANCDAVPRAFRYAGQFPLMFGWPLFAVVLALAARWRPAFWLAFTAVCGAAAVVGLEVLAAGPWSTEPAILGIGVPAESPGFTAWIPAGLILALAGTLEWVASRQGAVGERRSDGRPAPGFTQAAVAKCP